MRWIFLFVSFRRRAMKEEEEEKFWQKHQAKKHNEEEPLMRLRRFCSHSIGQSLLQIVKLKERFMENRSVPVQCVQCSSKEIFFKIEQKEKHSHDVLTLHHVSSDGVCKDRDECPFLTPKFHRAGMKKYNEQSCLHLNNEIRRTDGRITRQKARSWLSTMVLSVFFRSFRTLNEGKRVLFHLKEELFYRNWASACIVTKSHWWINFFFNSSKACWNQFLQRKPSLSIDGTGSTYNFVFFKTMTLSISQCSFRQINC